MKKRANHRHLNTTEQAAATNELKRKQITRNKKRFRFSAIFKKQKRFRLAGQKEGLLNIKTKFSKIFKKKSHF